MKMRQFVSLTILLPIFFTAEAFGQAPIPDTAELLRQLRVSVGNMPWNPEQGYRLSGQFVRDGSGEEIRYKATCLRLGNRWVADFSHEDPSRNMRYSASGSAAWAASPEVTAEIAMEQLPYVAGYDFPVLYHELLRLLQEGTRNSSFKFEQHGNEVYIQGKLRGGEEATFLFNTVGYFPRKVTLVAPGHSPPAWLFLSLEPDAMARTLRVGGLDKRFEVWFSDPGEFNGYRFPQRTDFVEGNGVTGSFFLEAAALITAAESLFERPPIFPWAEGLSFTPAPALHRPSLYLAEADFLAFRSRLKQSPWMAWERTIALAAAWSRLAAPIRFFFPRPPPFSVLIISLALALLVFLALIWRLRRRGKKRASWLIFVAGGILWFFVLLSGLAAISLGSHINRSLLTLHAAIRYVATGNTSYARTADRLLDDLAEGSAPRSTVQLARACQAYSLAYDLISPELTRARQGKVESALFSYARPLFGSMHGWRSNTASGSVMSSGLGMVGLTIGCDAYLNAARQGIEKTFSQVEAGLHKEGPGFGSYAFDNLANFMFALKRTGTGNYYQSPGFEDYVRATSHLLTPVGTLPLFGETSLDQARHAIPFLLKVADHVPYELGRVCVSVHDRYWKYGAHSASGWRRLVVDILEPHLFILANPYTLLQYGRALPAVEIPGTSALLGNGQAVVLRSGTSADALYLAMNMLSSGAAHLHRDILTFDLYAYESLLLHGPGFPGEGHPARQAAMQTSASNSMTLDGLSQSRTQSTGVAASLLNQPRFDFVRGLADKTYDRGQVQRDVVMIRPEENHLGYFILIDEIHTNEPSTKVGWYLHGRGKQLIGFDLSSRWTSSPFSPSRGERILIARPLDSPGNPRSAEGTLYFEWSFLNQISATMVVEWDGSKRFCTILLPRKAEQPEPKIETLGGDSGRIGETDWVSLGDPARRRTTGPLTHASEYTILRERRSSFPAILMVQGLEIRLHSHSLASTKPVTVSLDGLQGGILNARPDTRLELRSTEIKQGDRFLLDEDSFIAAESGVLSLVLRETGQHSLRRAR